MAGWLYVLEAYLVQALLRTPAFHRAVEKVVKGVHRIRHGVPPDELGGTKLDQPGISAFSKHFLDEIKTQIGQAERKEANRIAQNSSLNARGQQSNVVEGENADAVWQKAHKEQQADAAWQNAPKENADAVWESAKKSSQQTPKAGFMQEYMDALREQVRNQKNGR